MKRLNEQRTRREFLQDATQASATLATFGGAASASHITGASEAGVSPHPRISYFCNGEIHVNEVGKPEGKPLTKGYMDFKPSWSKTGDMLVCFRRTKDDPVTVNWKSAIFVIHIDGTGMHMLSDGTRTDFNPTWTRDGHNTPIWNRKSDKSTGFHVMQSKVGGKPGEEVPITDDRIHTWAHSCLIDGRIVVNCWHPTMGFGLYLLTPRKGPKPLYERIQCELFPQGEPHRLSVSPSETKVCFEYFKGHTFQEPGHTLYIADFDVQQRTITNPKPIANKEGKPVWYAYPRWIEGEAAVVYHSTQTGKGQLYVYRLGYGSTRRISTNPAADYRYPHGEAAPC